MGLTPQDIEDIVNDCVGEYTDTLNPLIGFSPGVAVGVYYSPIVDNVYPYGSVVLKTGGSKAVTSSTIFEIASMTKAFTATILAYESSLSKEPFSLAIPVASCFPDLPK